MRHIYVYTIIALFFDYVNTKKYLFYIFMKKFLKFFIKVGKFSQNFLGGMENP